MDEKFIRSLEAALSNYRQIAISAADSQAREDHSRLISITERLVAALRAGDLAAAKVTALAFSRQVSDSYSLQPPEFKPLAQIIAEVKKRLG